MERVLITGGAGFLGRALIDLEPERREVHATQRRTPVEGCTAHTVELSDRAAVEALWTRVRPDLVIHTAYSTAAGERDIWEATRNVVDACLVTGARLLHLSTDVLLDGEHAPYSESAAPAPVHEYGRWKARAEGYVRERAPGASVVRTSLITSFAPLDPRSAWVVSGLRGEHPLTLFTDEVRCPIGREDLTLQLWEIAGLSQEEGAGVWHLAGPEALSRYALGLLIAARFGLPAERVTPASGRDSPAPRPRDVRLSTERADRMLRTRALPISVLATAPDGR